MALGPFALLCVRVEVNKCSEALQEEENSEEKWVQWCAEEKEERSLGKREMVVDGGAVKSFCP